MGGGVGIGDFNNDGLKDIVFTANQVSSKIYINKGNNKFEDITEKAGLTTNVWATGVSIVDINNDGYDDIYICTYGKDLLHRSKNLLYINQGNLTFTEEADAYGLADTSYSSQAIFFDYDRDGDLDMYLANYTFNNSNVSANYIVSRDKSGKSPANDKLYRNDGDSLHLGHPVFTDVTLQAGIKDDGYGLGVTVSDFNNDGWPDVYVANDFVSNDVLWLNNKNGTFTNCIDKAMRHQSYSSMGVDAADLNNDGLSDVVTLDMLPEYNERKKITYSSMNYERYQAERFRGYEPEFMRNMLQLNNGNRYQGDIELPFFSEIGQLAGISATDWSWSVLLADFNNDGWKDVHITNGIGRDFINADFLEFSNETFNTVADRKEQQKALKKKLESLNHVNLGNYLYINNHDLFFRDSSESAGINEPSMSNGAAYVDLDNDGDLDLVVNNIDNEAFVFINNTVQKNKPVQSHFLKLVFKGNENNKHGFGAKVCVYSNGRMQMQEQNPARGYYSSVDQDLIFGLGANSKIDSVVIVWPDGAKEVKTGVPIDQSLILSQKDAIKVGEEPHATPSFLFTTVTGASLGIVYRHIDYEFNDFAVQRLLPQKFSQLGPFLATGDIDNDGKVDFYVGGATMFSGEFFSQNTNHSFSSRKITDNSKLEEDSDCFLFDADNDGDLDLIVTYGDIQQPDTSMFYRPKLYINDGKGKFSLKNNAIPVNVRTIAGTVSAGDYDGDGDLDLFIGGRVASQYPLPARSFILQNDHGVFSDVTEKVCPVLKQSGMITSSVWTDFDNDKQLDLVVAGEWMPVRFFKNNHGKLQEVTSNTGLTQMNGMWRSLAVADIDNDGDEDIIAGNLGLNCIYEVTKDQPMQLFAKDLDGNGSIDPIFFYYIKDETGKKHLYPAISRAQFADQVPAIKKQFLYAKDYAKASFDNIFPGNKKEGLMHLSCDETRSCYFENLGGGKFKKHILPVQVQFAPVNSIICDDVDGDGFVDLIMAGNEYQADVMTGRYDASYGCFLKGNKNKSFQFVPSTTSGFIVDGDVKDMALIPLSNKEKILVVAANNDSLRVFKIRH
ncbi:MAG: VCBS repeat-containing protein, partial [Flavisolibacter sp.]|nr:VCBS repeat-containing protein [Flavisolibacter sp.]